MILLPAFSVCLAILWLVSGAPDVLPSVDPLTLASACLGVVVLLAWRRLRRDEATQ